MNHERQVNRAGPDVDGLGGPVVARFVADGELPSEVHAERHTICRRLTPAQRREAESRLRGLP